MPPSSQKHLWNEEHRSPKMLLPMDGEIPSSSLPFFLPFLKKLQEKRGGVRGIEMGCGKGRNCIALAKRGIAMIGFDFSDVAIAEAAKRASAHDLPKGSTMFIVHDARQSWPFEDSSFDFGFDCFATTDIETEEGRLFVRDEFLRILKPGGFLFIATISSESPYHREKLASAGKIGGEGFLLEKTYMEEELRKFYGEKFAIKALERTMKCRALTVDSREHDTEDFWLVAERP